MKNTLKLENPISVNGKKVTEVTYDSNEITASLFSEADARRKMSAGMKNISLSPAVEFDTSLHLYLGFAAIIAVNSDFDFSDVERIHGIDIMSVVKIGRNFTLKSEDSRPNNSDEQSGATADTSTQA